MLKTVRRDRSLRFDGFVAQGVATGPKSENTIALNGQAGAAAHPSKPLLLGHQWLERWRRSSARFPTELPADDRGEFVARIEGHAQFERDKNHTAEPPK